MSSVPSTIQFANVQGNDTFTKLLLPLFGLNTGTTFLDVNAGGSIKTFTAGGSAVTSTTNSKYAGSSLLIPSGSTHFITCADSADFAVGASNFVYDFWFKRNGGAGTRVGLFGQADASFTAGCIDMEINTSNVLRVVFTYNAGASAVVATGATLTDTASFHHIAVIRSGNNLTIALDGTLGSAASVTGLTADNAAGAFYLGRVGLFGNSADANFAAFRLSVGTDRGWSANFTAPQLPYC